LQLEYGQPLPEAHPFASLRTSSGPLLDRIDIHVDVPRVEYEAKGLVHRKRDSFAEFILSPLSLGQRTRGVVEGLRMTQSMVVSTLGKA